MLINKINFNTPIKFFGNNRKTFAPNAFGVLNCDTFERKVQSEYPKTRINEYSRIRVPFGVNRDFITCPDDRLNEIFKLIPHETKEAAKESVFAGKKTKDIYDEKYGKDNYVIVSIGTSPAGIAKAMEYMGADVRYVPISNLDELISVSSNKDFFNKQKDANKYRAFLDSIGLNKKQIEEDKRHYIAIDYKATGDSLMVASDIARSDLGINSKNLTFDCINEALIEAVYSKHSQKDQERISRYITNYFELAKIEKFCGIPHLSCKNLSSIDKQLKTNKSKDARDFEFGLCYYLKNGAENED